MPGPARRCRRPRSDSMAGPRTRSPIRTGLSFRAGMLTNVGEAAHRDVYEDDEVHLDVSVAKTVTDRLTLSAQLNGLTARQELR